MSKCEHCGTELIYKCYRCGAPVCCPRCCADTEPRINGESMKLSEILKDWPEKMEELDETEIYNLMIEHFPELCPRSNETGMELQQGIKAIRKGKNFIKAISALTSCDREIDREALAKALYFYDYPEYKHGDWYYLLDKSTYIDKAQAIISTMPTWLKRIEK